MKFKPTEETANLLKPFAVHWHGHPNMTWRENVSQVIMGIYEQYPRAYCIVDNTDEPKFTPEFIEVLRRNLGCDIIPVEMLASLLAEFVAWLNTQQDGEALSVEDLVFEHDLRPEELLPTLLAIFVKHWPHLIVEQHILRELFVYKDKDAKDAWDKYGYSDKHKNSMIHIIFGEGEFTLVVDQRKGNIIIDDVISRFGLP